MKVEGSNVILTDAEYCFIMLVAREAVRTPIEDVTFGLPAIPPDTGFWLCCIETNVKGEKYFPGCNTRFIDYIIDF